MIEVSSDLKRITGAIFDLDGTLLDTMAQWHTLGSGYLREHGIEPKPDILDRLESMSLRESATLFHNEYGVNLTIPQIFDALVERIRSLYTTNARIKPGALNTLRTLKRGGVEIALATATSIELARAGLTLTGAINYFTGFFSCRDPKIKEGKTAPKIYDTARTFLGSSLEETIVVEDALYAIQTAKKAGYFVIGIEDEAERRHKDEIIETVNVYVRDHSELCAWLSRYFGD